MKKTSKPQHLFWIILFLGACQIPPSAEVPSFTISPQAQASAQATCGGCHAVGRYGSSSNSMAPPFADIANREGLTADTLSLWLRGAHNYPSEMDFQLDDRDVDKLVAYIVTLRGSKHQRQ